MFFYSNFAIGHLRDDVILLLQWREFFMALLSCANLGLLFIKAHLDYQIYNVNMNGETKRILAVVVKWTILQMACYR